MLMTAKEDYKDYNFEVRLGVPPPILSDEFAYPISEDRDC